MTEERDPVRLLDDAEEPSSLRDLLRAGRDEMPTDDAVERIERRVLAVAFTAGGGSGGAGGGGAPAVSGGASAVSGASLAMTGAGVGLGAIGIVALGLLLSSTDPPARLATVDAGAVSDDAAVAVADATAGDAGADAGGLHAPDASPPARTVPPRLPLEPSEPGAATEELGSPAAVESEAAMLLRAQRALRTGGAAEALAIADECAALHPDGASAQEREMIAIEALVALGREPAARERAGRFRARWPGSSHVRRLDVLLPP